MATKFQLDDTVVIGGDTGVEGKVLGITTYAEHTGFQPNYCVRFKHPVSGLPVDEWYTGELLTAG